MLIKANLFPKLYITTKDINDIGQYYFAYEKIDAIKESNKNNQKLSWFTYFSCFSETFNREETTKIFKFLSKSKTQKELYIKDLTDKNKKYILNTITTCPETLSLLLNEGYDFSKEMANISHRDKRKKIKDNLLKCLLLDNQKKDKTTTIPLKMNDFIKNNIVFFKSNKKQLFDYQKSYKTYYMDKYQQLKNKTISGINFKAQIDKYYLDYQLKNNLKDKMKLKKEKKSRQLKM